MPNKTGLVIAGNRVRSISEEMLDNCQRISYINDLSTGGGEWGLKIAGGATKLVLLELVRGLVNFEKGYKETMDVWWWRQIEIVQWLESIISCIIIECITIKVNAQFPNGMALLAVRCQGN